MSSQAWLGVLAGAMLVLAFYTTFRMRLSSMLRLYAAQSALLALFACVAARELHDAHLFVTAILAVALKVFFLPWFLSRTARQSGTTHRMQAYLRPATGFLVASVLILGAFILTRSLISEPQTSYVVASASVSMVMLGLLMLVARKGMYGQIIGFLLMENGIFIFGLALTGGMPLLVELGIFFDVAIGGILMAALSYRVQREHETVTTDALTELVD